MESSVEVSVSQSVVLASVYFLARLAEAFLPPVCSVSQAAFVEPDTAGQSAEPAARGSCVFLICVPPAAGIPPQASNSAESSSFPAFPFAPNGASRSGPKYISSLC